MLERYGPDAPAKKIKLRLDSEDEATADLGGGRRAIVPGNPEQSQLVRRITSGDEMTRMPPVDSGHKLTQTEIDLLVEWVRQGRAMAASLVIHHADSAFIAPGQK